MKILEIKVVPQAKKELIKEENGILKVYLMAPAVDGKANDALIVYLAEYFQVKKRDVQITKGLKSRHKTITILGL
ncbi:MAG: DUF167 domain-containing protein [Candidatus Omnitrophica bacterium]|nr:DUF167 domain-containing protein [Candidatus Omnitrophota bacterium]